MPIIEFEIRESLQLCVKTNRRLDTYPENCQVSVDNDNHRVLVNKMHV